MQQPSYASQLYTQYQALWHRVAYRIVHNADDAQDVVQEAYRKFLAVEREWSSLDDARRYFSAILTNTAIDFYKLARRDRERVVELSPEIHGDAQPISDWRRPWDHFERVRETRLLEESMRALRQLPAPQRQAIQLLLLQEAPESLSETSRRLRLPISTLKSRCTTGIEKVRKKLRKKNLL